MMYMFYIRIEVAIKSCKYLLTLKLHTSSYAFHEMKFYFSFFKTPKMYPKDSNPNPKVVVFLEKVAQSSYTPLFLSTKPLSEGMHIKPWPPYKQRISIYR